MKPFAINFNQILALFNPAIHSETNAFILFSHKKQFFSLYIDKTSGPLKCMHIPTRKEYAPWQVFYLLSDTLLIDKYLKNNGLKKIPALKELTSITEVKSQNEIFLLSLGLNSASEQNIKNLSKENQHILDITRKAEKLTGFDIPVFINNRNSLSFVLDAPGGSLSNSFQVCDFSISGSYARFSNTGGGCWYPSSYTAQKLFLLSFSPISFLQYLSEKPISDKNTFLFSPEFSQSNFYEFFFEMVNAEEIRKMLLLHSTDLAESINCVRFVLYCFNYYTNITTSFNLTSNHLELTFVYDKKEEYSLIFSEFFDAVRANISNYLSLLPETQIDRDFLRIFRPFEQFDNFFRYPDLEKEPINPKDDVYFCIPLKEEIVLALLTELPKLFNSLFNDPNHSFEIELTESKQSE
ncbi:hypothetical protein [Marinilabilia salmonicolor]|uniref:hypothetical protein n=1 Tax=Marinilabilia salmonicolor TaxID=989 RepID=UPI00029A6241|nr:hypothetical protein [Marinilabilia salmonicolor]